MAFGAPSSAQKAIEEPPGACGKPHEQRSKVSRHFHVGAAVRTQTMLLAGAAGFFFNENIIRRNN